jgi:hypothetical protein
MEAPAFLPCARGNCLRNLRDKRIHKGESKTKGARDGPRPLHKVNPVRPERRDGAPDAIRDFAR